MTGSLSRWADLRRFTAARVALGRAGNGVPTRAHLAFQAAHAAARDAVHTGLDIAALQADLAAESLDSVVVHSAAPDRHTYLLRPDLGRRLRGGARADLPLTPGAMLFVICDGLSALAVQRHAASLLAQVRPRLDGPTTPVVIVEQGRVAIGDEIGAAIEAEAVAVLIGERPGLSAADSLSVYLTWRPMIGRTDAERNCISNIRPEGLSISTAADKLVWLIAAMQRLRVTGIALKDEQPRGAPRLEPNGQTRPAVAGSLDRPRSPQR
jgi:ethanolamine ammonia-lyase small subunit